MIKKYLKNLPLPALQIGFGALMATVLLVVLIGGNSNYIGTIASHLLLPNIVTMLIGVAGLLILGVIFRKLVKSSKSPKRSLLILLLLSLGAFIVQLILIKAYQIYTDWDVDRVFSRAIEIATGQHTGRVPKFYFNVYPNNSLIVIIFAGIIKIVSLFGYHNYLFSITFVICLLCWISGILLFQLIRRLFPAKNWLAWLTWAVYAVFVGLQPWFSIPYSDSLGIIFPITILYIYSLQPVTSAWQVARWATLFALSYVGYLIKPQILIVFIAIFIYQLYSIIKNHFKNGEMLINQHRIKIITAWIISASIICVIFTICVKVVSGKMSQGMPINHYLLMGLNTETGGGYNVKDVNYTLKINADQSQINREIIHRLQVMGIGGFAKQMQNKALVNYNDGLFNWGSEGLFYLIIPKANSSFDVFIRNIYYRGNKILEDGRYNGIFQALMQAIWLALLLLGLFAISSQASRTTLVAMLAIIGLTIFEQLFEARSRYLFIYLPFYILLAIVGINNLFGLLAHRYRKHRLSKSKIPSKARSFRQPKNCHKNKNKA